MSAEFPVLECGEQFLMNTNNVHWNNVHRFQYVFFEIPKTRFVRLLKDSKSQNGIQSPKKKKNQSILGLNKSIQYCDVKCGSIWNPPHPSLYPLTLIYFIQYIWGFSNSFNLVFMSHELLGNLLRWFCEGDIHLSSVEMGHILFLLFEE